MLKQAVASKAAKLLMTCVCPVAGTTALTLGVPQARDAVHKAVQPRQYAKPKTRIRAHEEEADVQVASRDTCPTATPFAMANMPLTTPKADLAGLSPAVTDVIAHNEPQLAEVSQPDKAVPLTPRIFIPRGNVLTPTDKSASDGVMAWAQLVLGDS